MYSIAGSAHLCKAPPIGRIESKHFSSRRPSSQWRRHFTSLHGRRRAQYPRTIVPRAEKEDTEEQLKPSQTEIPNPAGREQVRPKSGGPPLEKGQGTAIVTGAISIIFGVLYLVLVQLLDTRGNQLEPPPPEAFEQGYLFLLRDLF